MSTGCSASRRARPGGKWSRINTDQAAELIEAGRMRPAGQREVELAQADGRWAAAYEQATADRARGPGPRTGL